MYVEGEGSQSVAAYTGRYTPQQGAVYAKACKAVCDTVVRQKRIANSELTRLANQSSVATGKTRESKTSTEKKNRGHGTKQFLLRADDRCVDLNEEDHRSSPHAALRATYNTGRGRRT